MRREMFIYVGLLILCLPLSPTQINAQDVARNKWPVRYINNIVNNNSPPDKPRFLSYPTVAYTPETSWEFGFSSLLVYYANRDTTNRLSEITGFTFITIESQWGFWFDHALYTQRDEWFILGRIRLQNFPLKYYGIGMQTPPEHQATVDANQILIKERLLRKIGNNLFTGFEFDFQHLGNASFEPGPAFDMLETTLGADGSNNLGLGFGILYDNRHNILNVRSGALSELAVLHYPEGISSFRFTSLISDNRFFKSVAPSVVLAGQFLGQFNFGDVPFNQLALMGGENMMRGYYLGRYRDNHQLAAQAEIRFLPLPLGFSKRIGATAFGGLASVFNDLGNLTRNDLVWSAGAGARFLIFPEKDVYTRFDVAFTREGSGLYLYIGEAF